MLGREEGVQGAQHVREVAGGSLDAQPAHELRLVSLMISSRVILQSPLGESEELYRLPLPPA